MEQGGRNKNSVKNSPKLRFPGFDEDWVRRMLGNVIDSKSRKFNPDKEDRSYKCVELEHLSSETGQLLGYVNSMDSGSIKNKFEEGNILFGKLRPYLRKFLKAPFDGVCSSEIWVLKGVGITNDFLFYVVQTNSFIELANQSSGSKMPRADWNVVSSGVFAFPKVSEQTKIASFFTAVDDKISQLKKKKTLLEQYKKGMIQRIFSQEIRFKDDDGKDFPDWEEKTLGDLGETYNGLTGKTKENFGQGRPYIQYKQIFDDSKIDTSRFDYVEIGENETQSLVQFGDVFFTTSSETPDEIGTASVLLDNVEELYLNSFCFGYRPNSLDSINPFFARYLFRNEIFRSLVVKLAQGSTRYNMSKVQLMKLEISLPSIHEQTKIANFLSAIDDKIIHTATQIEKTQQWKKGLLQQMFC